MARDDSDGVGSLLELDPPLGDRESSRTVAQEADEAQLALFRRPRLSVATRILAAFAALFAVFACVTVAAVVFIARIGEAQAVLERAAAYEFEIQQARRYEKNFFLYGTNLHDALASCQAAAAYLERESLARHGAIGAARLASLRSNLAAYEQNLERLAASGARALPSSDDEARVASNLRRYGAQIVLDAQEMVDAERLSLHTRLHTSTVLAVAFLAAMLVIMLAVAGFLTRTVLQPLGRFMDYMQRIGSGDYSPITPVRRYRDEFSNLAMAINRMLHELKAHQERLVHSERMAAVGTLTSGVAHELNNPLNNISLNTETLVEEYAELSDDQRLRLLDQIHAQVERASGIVRQLLDFTRKDQPAFTAVAVPWLVESTLKLVGNGLTLGHVEAVAAVAPDLPRVSGNPRSLQQVLLNLFLNAIQAMPGGGTLRVSAARSEGNAVRIDVADTGVGIPAEHLAHVFDPFFTTKEPGRGTGLGLAVAYSIIEKHRGRLTVASAAGRGTTFTVVLPASEPAAGPGAEGRS